MAVEFKDTLKSIRRAQGLTQAALVLKVLEKTGIRISISKISKLETGERKPSVEDLMDLSKTLNVSTDTLLYGEKRMNLEEPFYYREKIAKILEKKDSRFLSALLTTLENK